MLSGWLLLHAPYAGEGPVFATGAPLTRWDQEGAFDTAAECEETRRLHIEFVEKIDARGRPPGKPSLAVTESIATRCVPAAHIYPPRK